MHICNNMYLFFGDSSSLLTIKETTTFLYFFILYREKKYTDLSSPKLHSFSNLFLITYLNPMVQRKDKEPTGIYLPAQFSLSPNSLSLK